MKTRHRKTKGPRKTSRRPSVPAAPPAPKDERFPAPEPEPLESPTPPEEPPLPEPIDPEIDRAAERLREEEDDFTDGRSSAGIEMRDEEDAWGRVRPDERPFETEDVPPREEPEPEGEAEPPEGGVGRIYRGPTPPSS